MSLKQNKKTEYVPKVKILTTNFADMKAGQKMAIGTPSLIANIIKKIPKGTELSLSELRFLIAKKLKAQVACPVTTSMYLRIAVETEYNSKKLRYSFPFWRVISPSSKVYQKFNPSLQKLIREKRSNEGLDCLVKT